MNPSICGHVYVVDDNPDIRFYLTDLLRQMGYSIEGYDSAQAFLQQSIDIFPAVLVLDVRMPGMSGVDLQEKMRSLGRHTPIIFISGESLPAQIIQAMKQGAVDFLLKPFSMESLLRAIGSALQKDVEMHNALQQKLSVQERFALLTPREKVICAEMVSGRSNKEIANASGSAAATVKLHRARVLSKMKARALSDLIELFENINIAELA